MTACFVNQKLVLTIFLFEAAKVVTRHLQCFLSTEQGLSSTGANYLVRTAPDLLSVMNDWRVIELLERLTTWLKAH